MADDLDIILVFGGTNDFGHSPQNNHQTEEFGQFTDGAKENLYTFYAGLFRLFKKLYNKYRGKPIIVLTPLHHGVEVDQPEFIFNSDGSFSIGLNPVTDRSFEDYVIAIREVSAYYSFDIIDCYAESGLNPCLEIGNHYYFTDGLHPSVIGGNKLGDFLYVKLKNML